jgi:hypothetical protein
MGEDKIIKLIDLYTLFAEAVETIKNNFMENGGKGSDR